MKKTVICAITLLLSTALLAGGCTKIVRNDEPGKNPNTADEEDIYDSDTDDVYDYSDDELDEEWTPDSTEEESQPLSAEVPEETEYIPEEPSEEPEETEEEAPPIIIPASSEQAPEEEPQSGNSDTISGGVTANGHAIEVRNGVTYIDGVIIANKTYTLPASYNPGDLTGECYSAFYKMQNAAAADGVSLFIMSGFRSYELQDSLYSRYCARDGREAADTYSARPGHSEHQTGLAMDLNSLSSSFGNTAEGRWLASNCWKYGFIIRYPADKVAITGYMYEPWHVRYVGDIAEEIYANGLCLEEYFGITSSYS